MRQAKKGKTASLGDECARDAPVSALIVFSHVSFSRMLLRRDTYRGRRKTCSDFFSPAHGGGLV